MLLASLGAGLQQAARQCQQGKIQRLGKAIPRPQSREEEPHQEREAEAAGQGGNGRGRGGAAGGEREGRHAETINEGQREEGETKGAGKEGR